jgi:hypothetical protein
VNLGGYHACCLLGRANATGQQTEKKEFRHSFD